MWRAMASLLTLLDQVNAIAPGRSRASDGLKGDAAHQLEQSDHNPHDVEGVGRDIVTAEDLTHDPAGGFDSYAFAEVLRVNRDRRIKYVISNRRIFSSYASGSRAPWTWGSYSGADPHTNHVHISVLDAPISDTRTPWNLSGFEADMTPAQQYVQHVTNYRLDSICQLRPATVVPPFTATDGSVYKGFTEPNKLSLWTLAQTQTDAEIEDLVRQTLQAISDDQSHPVTLTPADIALMSKNVVDGVTTAIDVPTAQENAEATADELHERTAD
jgi:hypothetical protein